MADTLTISVTTLSPLEAFVNAGHILDFISFMLTVKTANFTHIIKTLSKT